MPRIRHNDQSYDYGSLAGEDFGEEGVQKIAVALSHNHTLVILSLGSIRLNDAGDNRVLLSSLPPALL